MSNVKISGFYDEANPNIEEQCKLVVSFNEKYLCPRRIKKGKEITDYTKDEFEKEVKPILDKYGVKFSSIGSKIGKMNLYDNESYEIQKNKLKELVKIAQLMECKYIRIFSFFVEAKGNYDEYFPEVVKKLKGFLEIVKGTDVILLHENEKKIFGDTPERVKKLYSEINDPQFKLVFDASNYIQCDVDAKVAYEELKDITEYYHIKDCSKEKVEVPIGMGEGGYEHMIYDLIVNRKYDGFLTLEPHTGKYAIGRNYTKFLFPITNLIPVTKNWKKVFDKIDAKMGIKKSEKVSTTQIFKWQYDGLKIMIKNAEEKEN